MSDRGTISVGLLADALSLCRLGPRAFVTITLNPLFGDSRGAIDSVLACSLQVLLALTSRELSTYLD